MTIEELEVRMTSAEIERWRAFEGEYGIPDGYFVVGQLAALVAAVAGNKGACPSDFVPYFRAQKAALDQDPAETRAILRAHLDALRARR